MSSYLAMGVKSDRVHDLVQGDTATVIVFSIAWSVLVICAILIYFLYLLSIRRESEDSDETLFGLFQSWARRIVRNNKINTHLALHGSYSSDPENKSSSSRKEVKEDSSVKRSGRSRSWSLSAFFAGGGSQKSSPRITPFLMSPPSFVSARHSSSTLPTNATSRASVQSFASFENTTHHTVQHYPKTIRTIVAGGEKTRVSFLQRPRKMVFYTRTCTLSDESCGDDYQTTIQVYRERRKVIDHHNLHINKRDNSEYDFSCRLDILPSIIETQTLSTRDEFTPSNRTLEYFTNQQFQRPQGLFIASDLRKPSEYSEESIRPVDILLPSFPPFEPLANEHYMEIDLPEEEYYLNNEDDEEADAKSIPLDD